MEHESIQFFYREAGYSFNPPTETAEQGRQRGAELLAAAERLAKNAGFSFIWSEDPEINSSDFDDSPEPWSLWQCCALNSRAEAVAALGGIDFGRDGSPDSSNYRRVIEAELALEAFS